MSSKTIIVEDERHFQRVDRAKNHRGDDEPEVTSEHSNQLNHRCNVVPGSCEHLLSSEGQWFVPALMLSKVWAMTGKSRAIDPYDNSDWHHMTDVVARKHSKLEDCADAAYTKKCRISFQSSGTLLLDLEQRL